MYARVLLIFKNSRKLDAFAKNRKFFEKIKSSNFCTETRPGSLQVWIYKISNVHYETGTLRNRYVSRPFKPSPNFGKLLLVKLFSVLPYTRLRASGCNFLILTVQVMETLWNSLFQNSFTILKIFLLNISNTPLSHHPPTHPSSKTKQRHLRMNHSSPTVPPLPIVPILLSFLKAFPIH